VKEKNIHEEKGRNGQNISRLSTSEGSDFMKDAS
jgi:hypothetical protein